MAQNDDHEGSDDLRLGHTADRIAGELLAALDDTDVLTRLCTHVTEELSCDASHVFLWSDERQAFAAVAHSGESPELWGLAQLLEIPGAALGSIPERLRREGLVQVEFPPETTPETSEATEVSAKDLEVTQRVVSMARRAGWRRCLLTALVQGDRLIGFQTACLRDAEARFGRAQMQLAKQLRWLATFAARYTSLAQRLMRANRLQSRFVANMSHELRTPLNVIIGYNALLLEGQYGPIDETQRDILARISLRARELFDLISSTLDLSKLESGQMPFEWRKVDVPKLMAEVEAETRHLQTRPDVRFRWYHEEPLPALHTDPSKLRVVLANLIANAAKFTERGEVNILARVTEEAFQFVVSDTGIGIDPEMLPVIFEPFRTGGAEEAEHRPGVGLGLYIVRRLVERLHGKVQVESQPRRGSRFVVQLPLGSVAEE